jgi:hypothetical protein
MADVKTMSTQEKIGEAIRRSLPLLPAEAREQVKAMLTPESLAIISGTLVVWAGSHFFGVGEIVDVILLVIGFAAVGLGVFSGAEELYNFATTAINAQLDADLDRAAQHFAKAVNILGITVISAILLKKSANQVVARGKPQIKPMPKVGPPPPGGAPKVTYPLTLPGGALGATDAWGNIAVSRNQSLVGQQLTYYHEWVHSILSPRFFLFRGFRARLNMSAYMRSSLLRYIEEAMAESYAQLRVRGLQHILVGIRFPITEGYVTVSQLVSEGVAIGNITLGGMRYTVYIQKGTWKP